MKSFRILSAIFLLSIISLNAQDIVIQKFIGKNIKEAITNYGKPSHQDKTDPDMVMTFFKTPNRDYTFVSDSGGIYQANAALRYDNKDLALTALNTFLKDCLATGYVVDTLAAEKFELRYPKIDMKVSTTSAEKNKYQIIIEAVKREE